MAEGGKQSQAKQAGPMGLAQPLINEEGHTSTLSLGLFACAYLGSSPKQFPRKGPHQAFYESYLS